MNQKTLIGTLSLDEIKNMKVVELEKFCRENNCKFLGIKKGEVSVVTLWKNGT